MKTYFDENNSKCVVTLQKTKEVNGMSVVDVSELLIVVKALNLLGKRVERITLHSSVFYDIDSPYYRRYDEEYLGRLYQQVVNFPDEVNLIIKNKRLYTLFEGQSIICPVTMKDMLAKQGEKKLTLELYY